MDSTASQNTEDGPEILPETLLSRNPKIVASKMDDDIVMMDAEYKHYFGMKDTAVHIWEFLEQPATFSALIEALTESFEVEAEQCAADVRPFLASLIRHEMLIVGDPVKHASTPT